MEDEEYVRNLLAILTNPTPTGIDPTDPYGQADDGIDRYDGFGSDVWVVGIEVVTEGPHGAELEIQFELSVPSEPKWTGLAPTGSITVPFDSVWCALSGFETPAAYAPEVARQVFKAANVHCERHQSRLERDRRPKVALPPRGIQLQLLLDALAAEGRVRQVSAERFELRPGIHQGHDVEQIVSVVVTPSEWAQVLANEGVPNVDAVVGELLASRQADERFVVFYDGELVRSTREELPPVRGRALQRRMSAHSTQDPGGAGGWFAYNPAEQEVPQSQSELTEADDL